MNAKLFLPIIATIVLGFSSEATNYAGNGNSGFGGSVGGGSLGVTDNGSTITFTFNRGPGTMDNDLVVYLDTVAGGFSSTSGFNDNADGGRSAVSGYGGVGQQSVLSFASGFLPDYALSIENGYASLFQLGNGGANSLTYITGTPQSGANNSASYSLTFNLSQLGLTPGSGQSFNLFGTLISTSGYRSDEAVAGNATGSQGWNPFTQSSFSSYTTTAVPEPASLSLIGLSALALAAIRRRK